MGLHIQFRLQVYPKPNKDAIRYAMGESVELLEPASYAWGEVQQITAYGQERHRIEDVVKGLRMITIGDTITWIGEDAQFLARNILEIFPDRR